MVSEPLRYVVEERKPALLRSGNEKSQAFYSQPGCQSNAAQFFLFCVKNYKVCEDRPWFYEKPGHKGIPYE